MQSRPKANPETIVIEYPRNPSISFSQTFLPYSLYFREPTTQRYFSVLGSSPIIRRDFGGSLISNKSGGKFFFGKSRISIIILYRIHDFCYNEEMLDIKFIRENKDLILHGAEKKHIDFNVEDLLKVDDERKTITTSIEKKRAEQNEVSD